MPTTVAIPPEASGAMPTAVAIPPEASGAMPTTVAALSEASGAIPTAVGAARDAAVAAREERVDRSRGAVLPGGLQTVESGYRQYHDLQP